MKLLKKLGEKNNIKSNILFIIFAFWGLNGLAQGGWDIIYMPIDLIDSIHVDEEIRLDFKTCLNDIIENKPNTFSVRKLLQNNDTLGLKMDNKLFLIKEKWEIYPDQGFLNDQVLIGQAVFDNMDIVISKLTLLSFNEQTVIVKAKVGVANSCGEIGENVEKTIEIPRNRIKGILMRIRN